MNRAAGDPRFDAPPGIATLLRRALRLKCPRCGGSGFVISWLRTADVCPSCGFEPARYDQGLVMGALAFNLVVGEIVAMGAVVTIVLATWPAPPWNWITASGIALAILMPFVFYPFSKTLFIGLNLIVRVFDEEPPNRR